VRNEKEWEEIRIDEVCSKITDGTHDTPQRISEGVKFITGKHIRPYFIDYDNSDYVTPEIHEEIYRRCNPERGDVLYTNIGVNLGTAALNTVDYEFSMKNVALLKPNLEAINGRFLEFYLNNSRVKSKILGRGSIGGAQSFLSLKEIRKIPVLVPPLNFQNQFDNLIKPIQEQKVLLLKSVLLSSDLFNSLLQRAFKGELIN